MTNQQTSSGIGLGGTLFIVFLILKLVGVISWSWWWVFSPLWIPFVLFIIILCIVVLFKLLF